jgi:hypothetical protein
VKNLLGAPLQVRLLAIQTLDWPRKDFRGKSLTYIADKITFITLSPGANVIKLFTDISYDFS